MSDLPISTLAGPPWVLVVADDLTLCGLLRRAVGKNGWGVMVASDAVAAQQKLLDQGFAGFDCVVIDYQVPGLGGLDFLAWLQASDPCLAAICLTAKREPQEVVNSLRAGAVDVLEKPVQVQELLGTIRLAAALTQQRRHTAEVLSSVKELGRAEARMTAVRVGDFSLEVDFCFHPRLETGGDFFSHFQPVRGQYCFLLTDVSGHDLKSAYLSAYIQGIVCGMLERGATLQEAFIFINRHLLEKWNECGHPEAGAATAACALLLDLPRQTVNVIACGSPTPIYVAPDGRAKMLTESSGSPLGWFADYSVGSVSHATTAGGTFFLWSDGLEDLAQKHGVSLLSMGFVLQRARLNQRPPMEVATAADDVLFAEVHLPTVEVSPTRWQPLVFEGYHGGQAAEIDQLQAHWSRSLRRAVPELTDPLLANLLLAAREAVLNALQHGCRNDSSQWVIFQISYLPAQQSYRIWVEDPGPGHDFDPVTGPPLEGRLGLEAGINRLPESAPVEFPPAPHPRREGRRQGLHLMRRSSQRLRVERKGALVIMDFNPESPSGRPRESRQPKAPLQPFRNPPMF